MRRQSQRVHDLFVRAHRQQQTEAARVLEAIDFGDCAARAFIAFEREADAAHDMVVAVDQQADAVGGGVAEARAQPDMDDIAQSAVHALGAGNFGRRRQARRLPAGDPQRPEQEQAIAFGDERGGSEFTRALARLAVEPHGHFALIAARGRRGLAALPEDLLLAFDAGIRLRDDAGRGHQPLLRRAAKAFVHDLGLHAVDERSPLAGVADVDVADLPVRRQTMRLRAVGEPLRGGCGLARCGHGRQRQRRAASAEQSAGNGQRGALQPAPAAGRQEK